MVNSLLLWLDLKKDKLTKTKFRNGSTGCKFISEGQNIIAANIFPFQAWEIVPFPYVV